MPKISSESVSSYLYLHGDKQTTLWHFQITRPAPEETSKATRQSFATLMDALAYIVAQTNAFTYSIVVEQSPMNDRLIAASEAELLVQEYLLRDRLH